MQTTSATFRSLRAAGANAVTTVTVARTALPTYVSLRTQRQLLAADKLVGNCYAAQIDLTILAAGLTIPRMAEIRLALAMSDGAQTSESIPKGTYYIDTRATEPDAELGDLTTIHGYDAMLKMEQPMIPAGSPSGAWPRTCSDVMAEIAQRIGVELDPRTNLYAYLVQYPDTAFESDGASGSVTATGMTMRTVAGYIAAMHGGNWMITETGKLYLAPLVPTGSYALGSDVGSLTVSPALDAITGVDLLYDGAVTFSAGDATGRVLQVETPWGTQVVADNILAAVSGYVYRPYEAREAILDPAAELGDPVTVGGVQSLLGAVDAIFDALYTADVSAPAEEEIDHEYPMGDADAALQQMVAQIVRAGITVGLDSIDLRVEQEYSTGGTQVASIYLTVGDREWMAGQIQITGNVDISGQLSADALYSVLGDIANLTVDRLSTSRRIVKYLAGDRTDDNYLLAEDAELSFVAGVYAGGTEQARNPNGALIYWEEDPNGTGVYRGDDGYPYKDGARIFITTAQTAWPVTVYTYTDQIKARFAFVQESGGAYTPTLTMGAGNSAGTNQAYLRKGTDGLELMYTANNSRQVGIKGTTDGYLDAYGLRRTTAMRFTDWDNGVFRERIEGKADAIEYRVEFDGQGRPVSISDDSGHTMEVYW